MRFFYGIPRILDYLRPHPKADMPGYWRAQRHYELREARRPLRPKPNQTGGWLPGRCRWGPLQAMRRVIEPAVRYHPVTRQFNEIVSRKKPQEFWQKKMPLKRGMD